MRAAPAILTEMPLARRSGDKRKILGPYSRTLRRGAIRDNIDGRSIEGRLIRDLEAQLIAHLGGAPSIVQRLRSRDFRGTRKPGHARFAHVRPPLAFNVCPGTP